MLDLKLSPKKKKITDTIAKLEEDLSVALVEENHVKVKAILKTIAALKKIKNEK
jgi:hypothetical protein